VKARGTQNPLKALRLKRGGRVVAPVSQTLDAGGGTFTFDFAAWAPTSTVVLELAGGAKTVTCTIGPSVLARLR
jgi:hypothetical protein